MEIPPDLLLDEQPVAWRAAKEISYGSVRQTFCNFKKTITFVQTAGMVAKVFEHPFDLTKVRLQAQVLDATARFIGPVDCLKKTWLKEGVKGLYRVCRQAFELVFFNYPQKF